MKSYPLIAIALLFGASCQRKTTAPVKLDPVTHEQAAAIAKQSALDAFGILSGELKAAIGTGGLPSAVSVCSEKAPGLLERLSAERGVKIQRRSDRPRNPAHAADARDIEVIAAFQESIALGKAAVPAINDEPGGAVTVRLPILISDPLCLQCHGTERDIAADTARTLDDLYPADLARGYKLNDLRGLWRITIPPPSGP